MYIHFGTNKFDPKRFVPVSNMIYLPKPRNGFWCSNVFAPYGWCRWVLDNDMIDTYHLDKCFTFNLKNNARVLSIHSLEDAIKLHEKYPFDVEQTDKYMIHLDWERIALDYDATDFSLSSDRRLYRALYGWNCDSTVIFNPNIIEVL